MAERIPSDAGEDRADRHSTRAAKVVKSKEVERAERKASLRTVPLKRLQDHPKQPEERHQPDRVIDLAASIATHGLAQPPLVSKRADGSLVIIAGHRRVAACRLLALDGRGAERVQAYVIDGLSETDESDLILAELFHRDTDVSAVAIAEVLGARWREREATLGRKVSVRALADIVPVAKKSAVHDYRTIYEALEDPDLEPLVRAADKAGKELLYKVLRVEDNAAKVAALEAFKVGGAAAMERAIPRSPRRGPPYKPVLRSEARGGDGYNLTIRYRDGMSTEHAAEALEALRELEKELVGRLDSAE